MIETASDRAVVLGGSVGGLLAARVLAETHRSVVVVERDRVRDVTTARRGVPQGRHVHGLLARGQQILEELFPGFLAEAVEAGIPTADLGELRWFFRGRRLVPAPTGLLCISTTRPVLEGMIRRRVLALPGIELREETTVDGLVTTPNGGTVVGVTVRPDGGAPEVLAADLVVDATGRGSRTPRWLAELGYQEPAEEAVEVDLTYTSRAFRLGGTATISDDMSINPVAYPGNPRGAFLSRIEGEDFVVSLTGVLGDRAPTDAAGFASYARSLVTQDVAEVMAEAEPLTDPVSFRYPASRRRHYERLAAFPTGLLVIGDAVCSFNPVYGQGMTVAALEALALREHTGGGHPDAAAWFAATAAIIDGPWRASTSGDLAFAGTRGRRTVTARFLNAFMDRVQDAAASDGAVTAAFMRVAGLVDPPTALFRPSLLRRVLLRRSAPAARVRVPECAAAPVG